MKHLKKFEAFSDYTNAIKDIGGKIKDKIGSILGNPLKSIKSSIKSLPTDIKNKIIAKIYDTEEYRDAAKALITINDETDKWLKLHRNSNQTEEAEQMLRYYIDMLMNVADDKDFDMLSKIDTSLLLVSDSKRKSLASRFKVPKFDGQSNKLSFTGVGRESGARYRS